MGSGSYNIDPDQITVSGVSSGGAMAMQFHFAHSSEIIGAGVFAGGKALSLVGKECVMVI